MIQGTHHDGLIDDNVLGSTQMCLVKVSQYVHGHE